MITKLHQWEYDDKGRFINVSMLPGYLHWEWKWYVNPYASTQTILSENIKELINYKDWEYSSNRDDLFNVEKCSWEIIALKKEYSWNKNYKQENKKINEAIRAYIEDLEKYALHEDIEKEINFIRKVMELI